ncbi:MAG: heterodisulfide reductase [Calditrichaeota bacterium]|jgi:heterodisulfide reductase subunit C2|nr:heterodisulfide reductase [Calditrichota bacterium]MBT7617190.1 heterodisulfide reductase [Calditrichota bacterium]MBT7787699.1 heterodisulfide reductase [Calditrichota bacterium]
MPIMIKGRAVNQEFIRKIKEISGEDIYKCMQCGTCAAACPMRDMMEISPTRAIHLIHFGLMNQVKASNTVWLCASCHTCESRCPRGLDLPKVMEAIRLLTLRENEDYVVPFEIKKEEIRDLPPIAMVAAFRKHTA